MASGKRSILIEVLGDFRDFATGAKKGEKAAQTFTDKVQGVGQAIALAYSAKKVVDFATTAAKAAGDLGESQSKVTVIFGESSKAILDWSKTTAGSMGLAQQDALDAASTFATFGKAAGLAGEKLNGFSTDLTGLAADLASFYNTSPQDAIEAIGAALRGESEPIRRYGVLLNDATLKQRALTLGIYDGEGALDGQQRVLAAQAEILAQTTDAQGDFNRTKDGAANQARILTAEYKNMQATIGQALLPVMKEIIGVVSGVFTWFNNLTDAQRQLVIGLGLVAGGLYIGVAAFEAVGAAAAALGLSVGGLLPILGAVALAVGAVSVVLDALDDGTEAARKNAEAFYATVDSGIATIDLQALAFKSAADAAKEYSDAAYADADKQLKESILGNRQFVKVMNQLGLSIDDVADANRTGADSAAYLKDVNDKLLDRARRLTGLQDLQAVTVDAVTIAYQRNGIAIDGQQRGIIKQIKVMEGFNDALISANNASYESVDIAKERMLAGDQEAAVWLKSTGTLTSLTQKEIEYAERLIDTKASAKDVTQALDDQYMSQSEMNKAAKEAAKAIKEEADRMNDLYDAARSSIDAGYNFRSSQRDTIDAIADLNKTLADSESTLFDVADAQDAAEQAAFRQADAAVRVAEEQAKANGTVISAEDKARIWSKTLDDLARTLDPASPLAKNIRAAADDIRNFPNGKTVTFKVTMTTAGGGSLTIAGARAAGGPVEAGLPYLVGEKRPEVFVPAEDGVILPRVPARTSAATSGKRRTSPGTSAAPTVVNNHITVAERSTADEIVRSSTWAWRIATRTGR